MSLRRHAVIALAALGLAGEAVAQSAPVPQRFVAIGCISAADGSPSRERDAQSSSFILTDTRGEPPLVYRLEGDPEKLKLHVGHTVEVSGPLSPGPPTGKGPHAAAPLMKVQSIVWIATTCPTAKK